MLSMQAGDGWERACKHARGVHLPARAVDGDWGAVGPPPPLPLNPRAACPALGPRPAPAFTATPAPAAPWPSSKRDPPGPHAPCPAPSAYCASSIADRGSCAARERPEAATLGSGSGGAGGGGARASRGMAASRSSSRASGGEETGLSGVSRCQQALGSRPAALPTPSMVAVASGHIPPCLMLGVAHHVTSVTVDVPHEFLGV